LCRPSDNARQELHTSGRPWRTGREPVAARVWLAAAQSCGISCAQIATVPMNSVIVTNVAVSAMKIYNIAGFPLNTSPAFQISLPAVVPVGNRDFKIGSGSVNAWLKVSSKARTAARPGHARQCATCCRRPAV
jgi:hypothetical protein